MDSYWFIRYVKHEEALEDTNNYKIWLNVELLRFYMQTEDKHPKTDKVQGSVCVSKPARQSVSNTSSSSCYLEPR